MASSKIIGKQSSLLKGIWIQWGELSLPEQFVCGAIVLVPLMWLWGWSYLLMLFSIGLLTRAFLQKRLTLGKRSVFVNAAFVMGVYKLITRLFFNLNHGLGLEIRSILTPIDDWIALGFVLWYIQSNDIRVRPKVIAWAISVLTLEMLFFWAIIFFVWKQAPYVPSRSLFGMLTGKGEVFVPGAGNSNFLMPYFTADGSLPGLERYVYFFHGPESLALVAGFICLLALDIKNKLWSPLLFSGAFFILLTSGTRSVWVTLPLLVMVRLLLTVGKTWGSWFICGLTATVSFVMLCIPAVTDAFLNISANTAQATSEFRGDSTDVRGEIYRRTFERLMDAPLLPTLFGHIIPGETVLPGYAPAMVGTHSFYLGSLLYLSGLVGTIIFVVFWIGFISWLHKTRSGRPLCCLLIFCLISLTLTVMAFESMITPIILVCAVMRDLPETQPMGNRYQAQYTLI